MKTTITKHSNGRVWRWEITSKSGDILKAGYCASKADAKNDAGIALGWLESDMKAADRVADEIAKITALA